MSINQSPNATLATAALQFAIDGVAHPGGTSRRRVLCTRFRERFDRSAVVVLHAENVLNSLWILCAVEPDFSRCHCPVGRRPCGGK
jgi:hypothetical protein